VREIADSAIGLANHPGTWSADSRPPRARARAHAGSKSRDVSGLTVRRRARALNLVAPTTAVSRPEGERMPLIFVDTDNADFKNKLFDALKAGKAQSKAEDKMLKAVKRVIEKAPGFTTTRPEKPADAKGYAIRLKVSKVDIVDRRTKCSLSGEIFRYPLGVGKDGTKAEEMVSTNMTAGGFADGTSENSALDCIEALVEDLVAKSVPAMQTDFGRR
jgi:hypothetical protein